MGLYLKYIGAASRSAVLRTHALATTIGISAQGGLCTESPCLPLFTILNNDRHYLILPEHPQLHVQTKLVPRAGRHLADGDVISFADHRIQVFIVADAPGLSVTNQTELKAWGTLEIKLAGIRQVVQLVTGTVSVGSSENDTVILPIQGVAPRHLEVRIEREGLRLLSAGGYTMHPGGSTQERKSINTDTVVRLEPIGIPVHLIKTA
jgi:hypothetical protein